MGAGVAVAISVVVLDGGVVVVVVIAIGVVFIEVVIVVIVFIVVVSGAGISIIPGICSSLSGVSELFHHYGKSALSSKLLSICNSTDQRIIANLIYIKIRTAAFTLGNKQ